MNIPNKIQNLVVGASGLGASEIAQDVIANSQDKASTITTIIVQIIIGISTLIGLFKRKKSANNSKS